MVDAAASRLPGTVPKAPFHPKHNTEKYTEVVNMNSLNSVPKHRLGVSNTRHRHLILFQ